MKNTEKNEETPLPAGGIQPEWRNRIIGHGVESPESFLANPYNWRVHPREQEMALVGVLDEIGWVQSVIVNKRTGFVVDGHLRIAASLSRNIKEIPVVYVDLTEEEEAKILATLDPIGGFAATDKSKFKEILDRAQISQPDVLKLVNRVGSMEDTFVKDGIGVGSVVPDTSRTCTCPKCGNIFPMPE